MKLLKSPLMVFMMMMVTLSFVCLRGMAAPAPFDGPTYNLIKKLNPLNKATTKQVHRTCVDFDGVASAGTGHVLGPQIPAGSLITASYYVVTREFTGSGALIDLGCDSQNDLFNDIDLHADATYSKAAGVADNTIANGVYVDAACTPEYTVTVAAITEGEACFFHEYVVAD